jgi:hypothetical protein
MRRESTVLRQMTGCPRDGQRVNRSRCFAVCFEQSAQSLATRYGVKGHVRFLRPQCLNGYVPQALMRPLSVIMVDVLPDQIVEVPLAAADEVVEALLLDRLDEPLAFRFGDTGVCDFTLILSLSRIGSNFRIYFVSASRIT